MMLTQGKVQESESPSRGDWRIAFAVILLALLVRGCLCFWHLGTYISDPDAYRAIAETLARTGVYGLTNPSGTAFPTAFRPPLYPYALSWLLVGDRLSLLGIASLHTVLGGVTAICTYLTSLRLLGRNHNLRCGILAACLVIVDPILLQQSTLVMTETLAAAIASIVVWWWVSHTVDSSSARSAMILGILLSLAYLCRPTFLVWAGMLCLGLAISSSGSPGRRSLQARQAAIATSIVVIAVGAWTLRNLYAIGHPVWATTHGGYTLLLGNNPMFYDYLRDGSRGTTWNADSFLAAYAHRHDADPTTEAFWQRNWSELPSTEPRTAALGMTESDDDQLAYEAAKATISREPAMFLWSCVIRVSRLWAPFPHHTGDRSWAVVVPVGLFYCILYGAIAVGLWKLGRELLLPCWWPILALLLTLTLVHAVYWSNIRMRAPAVPSLAIIAAAATRRPEQRDG